MDDTYAEDPGAPERSVAAALALAAVGLADASGRRAVAVAAFGVRAVAVAGGPVWRSAPAAPVRRAGRSVLDRLVEDGARRERLWSAETRVLVTERAVDAVLDAAIRYALVERVAGRLIAAGTLERVAGQVTGSPLPLRVVDDMLAEGVTEPIVARVVESPDLDRVVERVLSSPAVDGMITKVLDSPSTDRIVAQVLASPGLERLVVTVMESRLVDDLTDRVIASEELQRVVTAVAQSPMLRSAIAESSASMAGELAEEVRERTVVADDRAERVARRLLRRKPIPRMGPPEPPPAAGAPG
jgi:hypothetical protein